LLQLMVVPLVTQLASAAPGKPSNNAPIAIA
jgi:hypothetical protein